MSLSVSYAFKCDVDFDTSFLEHFTVPIRLMLLDFNASAHFSVAKELSVMVFPLLFSCDKTCSERNIEWT